MDTTQFQDKRVAVLGLAVNNQGVVEFLTERGAHVEVFDEKNEEDFDREFVEKWKERGVGFHFERSSPLDSFDIAIRTPGIPLGRDVLRDAQEKGVLVTSVTNIFFEVCPCPVIGVTGTKGKGTTATLIYEMLKAEGKDAYLGGNVGVPVLSFFDNLTPESWVVYELSSFQLIDAARSPHIAVVLMTTSEHLDFHRDEEEYVYAKANIVRFQGENDIAIVNADYENSKKISDYAQSQKFWVSAKRTLEKGCFVDGEKVVLATRDKKESIIATKDILLPGPHNLENVCAAVLAAHFAGVSHESMKETLRIFKGLPHRLELVGEARGVRYYDDSISTTPESTIAAIKAFQEPKILVLGGSSKGADFTELAKTIASDKTVKAVIGIGEEWPRIKEAIERESNEGGSAPPSFVDDCVSMKEVVHTANDLAAADNVMLLSPACASFDMFPNYKERGQQFKEAVTELLQ